MFFFLNFFLSRCFRSVDKTGAFFDEDDTDSMEIFDIAISRQNAFNTKFRLEPIIKQIASMDSFQAEQAGNSIRIFNNS